MIHLLIELLPYLLSDWLVSFLRTCLLPYLLNQWVRNPQILYCDCNNYQTWCHLSYSLWFLEKNPFKNAILWCNKSRKCTQITKIAIILHFAWFFMIFCPKKSHPSKHIFCFATLITNFAYLLFCENSIFVNFKDTLYNTIASWFHHQNFWTCQ